jgi:hypothetical protein
MLQFEAVKVPSSKYYLISKSFVQQEGRLHGREVYGVEWNGNSMHHLKQVAYCKVTFIICMETLIKTKKNLTYECRRIWAGIVTYSRLKIFI